MWIVLITLTRQCVEWLETLEKSFEMLRHKCDTIDGDTIEQCRESNLATLAMVATSWMRCPENARVL